MAMIDPLVPPEVDLRNFPGTMIQRARLFASTFHARANDSEWRAGVTLWLKSWDQAPSGSLPDDDVDLCRLAELGRDLKTWRKLRPGAMRGWERASDGLLYHRVVAEIALEAWLDKLGQQLSGGAGNAKRWGFAFDASAIQSQIATSMQMLFALNPQSQALRKKRHPGIPTGQQSDPGATPNGNAAATPDGTPVRIAREVELKRSGREGILNRDVEIPPTQVAPVDNSAPKVNDAVEKIDSSKAKGNGAGQEWGSEAWVAATAKTVDKPRQPGEPFDAWKDRVYGAVQAMRAQAAQH